MKWVREHRENENFHEKNAGLLAKAKIFMRRAGEAAGESENSF